MANSTVAAMTGSALAVTDLFYKDTGSADNKITGQQIIDGVLRPEITINGAASPSQLVDIGLGGVGWASDFVLTSPFVSTSGHAGASYATATIKRTTRGSLANGPSNTDAALFVSSLKDNYLTSIITGEIDGIYVVARQGQKDDVGGILVDLRKVKGDTGGGVGVECSAVWLNSSGTSQNSIQTITGFIEGAGGPSGNTGYGFYAESQVGSNFSAFHVSPFGGTWQWAFTVFNSRTPGDRLFGIDGAGRVYMGTQADQIINGYNTTGHLLQWYNSTNTLTLMSLDQVGNLSLTAGAAIGGSGASLLKRITSVATSFNFPSIAAQNAQATTVTVTGAVVGDTVIVTPSTDWADPRLLFSAFVSLANTVSVTCHNYSTAAIDPGVQSFRLTVMGF